MTLFDVIGDLLELLFAAGELSPDTLRAQRLARLTVASIALVVNAFILFLLDPSVTGSWPIVVLSAATLAAAWVFVFSVVDIVKELPTLPLVSVAAATTAGCCLTIMVLFALGMMPQP
jgi:hypothetical protein